MQNILWFICGLFLGFTALSITRASVPSKNRVTDDTVLYQNLSEIHVKKQAKIDFDSDITRLSHLEARYREKLPTWKIHSRMKGRMQTKK